MPSSNDPNYRQYFLQPKHLMSDRDKGQEIKHAVSNLNRKFEEQDTQRRAAELSLPYFYLAGLPITTDVLQLVPQEQALAAMSIPFSKDGAKLKLGTVDPGTENFRRLIQDLSAKRYQPEIYLVSQDSFTAALRQYSKVIPAQRGIKQEVMVDAGPEIVRRFKDLPNLGKDLLVLPATQLLDLILGSAVTMHASDIHLEPEKKLLKVRFRVDGVLADMIDLPQSLEHVLLSRIKLLSGLKLNVTGSPQDGRFSMKLADGALDMRVSVLPSTFGESIVMRILGIQDVGLDIEKLGLRGRALEVIRHEIKKPNGMTLTTGPTGSGKTTTLYSFLNFLNKPGVKIITIEDPVEYQLEGVTQTPIDRAAGTDFASALRSILRQDPDIIMVGEIRDYETGETASQAALTGHVVLSTLHTNDAAGAIPRMLDLGVKPVTLAPALNALIAQRLVRRICEHCKQTYKPAPEELNRVRAELKKIPTEAKAVVPEHLVFYRSPGCAQCHQLGYKGRIGVFEVFAVDDRIEKLIYQQASTVDIKQAALEQGMVTMQQDGILKALEGVTDLSEVWRVTEE